MCLMPFLGAVLSNVILSICSRGQKDVRLVAAEERKLLQMQPVK